MSFLERMVVIAVDAYALEALYQRGQGERATPVVLAPGLPEEGALMDHAILSELCWGLSERGHPTLRFNYRGCGASSGPRGDAAARADDLAAAVEHMQETHGGRVHLIGHRAGARAVLEVKARRPAFVSRALVIETDAAIDDADETVRAISSAEISGATPGFTKGLPELRRVVADALN